MITSKSSFTLLIIELLIMVSCSTNQYDNQQWVTTNSEESSFLIKKTKDSIVFYIIEYNKCDTFIFDIKRFLILEQSDSSIMFKTHNSRNLANITFSRKRVLLTLKDTIDSSKVCYNLQSVKSSLSIDNKIPNANLEINDFLSEQIINQEMKINKISKIIELDKKSQEIVNHFNLKIKRLVSEYLDINDTYEICWKRISNLDAVIIYPKYMSKGNIEILDVSLNINLFEEYFADNYENINSLNFTYNKFLDAENLFKVKASVGEVIIFYNQLILEIYRNEYSKTKNGNGY